MRFLLTLAAFGWAVPVLAAGLAGTYVIDTPQGRAMAKLEVSGDRVTGHVDVNGRTRIELSGMAAGTAARGIASSPDGKGEFEATVSGDVLDLVISQQDGPNQRAARLPLRFQRAGTGGPAAATGGGDPRLVGAWSYQNVIVSGDASFATEERLAFRADGSYTYGKGRTAAGGSDWSFDGGKGGDGEHGLWRAEAGSLYIFGSDGQWHRIGKYGMTEDGSAMRITYANGSRKLWSRQRP